MLFLAVALYGGLFAQGFVTPPQSSTVTVHNEVTVQVPPPDPEATAEMAGQSFSGIVVSIIAPTLVGWTNSLLDIPDFFRNTPPDLTYRNPIVREMQDLARRASLALLGLAILGWGVQFVTRGFVEGPWRILIGLVLAAGNLVWWQWGIELNNAINNAIAAPTVGSLVRPHLTVPTLTNDPATAFAPTLTVIATAIVYLLLLFSMFVRLCTVDVLIAVGPLGLFCKAGEATERFYETYVGWSVGVLFSQIMVVITLKLATVMGSLAGGLAGTLLSLGILLLARQMPGVLASKFSQPRSGGGLIRNLAYLRRLVGR